LTASLGFKSCCAVSRHLVGGSFRKRAALGMKKIGYQIRLSTTRKSKKMKMMSLQNKLIDVTRAHNVAKVKEQTGFDEFTASTLRMPSEMLNQIAIDMNLVRFTPSDEKEHQELGGFWEPDKSQVTRHKLREWVTRPD
jgi:hypothetical protein